MISTETKRPRQVLSHRRGLILNPQKEILVSQPTALMNPPGNPDDDGSDWPVLQRRPDCPPWCSGHRPGDDDNFCASDFYAWVEAGKDTVVVAVSRYVGEKPRVCMFPDDSPDRGGRYPADKARAIAALLLKGADLIDPPAPTTPKAA